MANTKRQVNRGPKSRSQINAERQPNRVTMEDTRNILTVANADPSRYYHWFNDRDGGQRIFMMQQRGYRIETSTTLDIGDSNINAATDGVDSPIKRYVGVAPDGSAMYAYLMSIPMEYHEEDQAYLAQEAEEQELGILNPDLESNDRGADYVRKEHGLTSNRVVVPRRR